VLRGAVDFIAPKAVENDGITTFEIRAGLALKADRFVRAGYSATADIVVAQRAEVLGCPSAMCIFRMDRRML
jgi:HlyD family secretion protein